LAETKRTLEDVYLELIGKDKEVLRE